MGKKRKIRKLKDEVEGLIWELESIIEITKGQTSAMKTLIEVLKNVTDDGFCQDEQGEECSNGQSN